jgi:hypothetical protein
MKENKPVPAFKSLIEKARNNPTIMMICHHEYIGDYGKLPPEDWEPSDKEVLAVIKRSGFDCPLDIRKETRGIELNDDTVFIDNIAESIFNEATLKFVETFDEADLITSSYDMLGLSFTETKSNASECQQLIENVKRIVNESYSDIFDVSIEREVCDDDEFPDDVANITINLNWAKIYRNT